MSKDRSFSLRDRDAIITKDGLIFRVYGYSHPKEGYVCDPEYAPENIYRSENPRAYRETDGKVYFKFFADEGLRFIQSWCPRYLIWHEQLRTRLVGVKKDQISTTRQPEKELQSLLEKTDPDELVQALQEMLRTILDGSSLSSNNFGVFGSLLNGFYNPKFSDLDLVVYGRRELERVTETLSTLCAENESAFQNEFDQPKCIESKPWKFLNYSTREYVYHQRRKQIYALFCHKTVGRTVKAEFEPVRRWEEIENEYDEQTRISNRGWIKMFARVTEDSDSAFMPSVYGIKPIKVLENAHVEDVQRIVSYVEEFRMQARKDEVVYVEGNLENVEKTRRPFQQVSLTYCPRYYEQVLKILPNH